MKTWFRSLIAATLIVGASAAGRAPIAQQLPAAAPESVGVSSERLARLHHACRRSSTATRPAASSR